MVVKNLAAYLKPNLEIEHDEKTYVVPPPAKDVGLKLTAINTYGLAASLGPDAVNNVPPGLRAIAEDLADTDLGELSLGPAYQQMIDDNVPGPHIDTYALYALYYWVLGEDAADGFMEIVSGAIVPKAPMAGAPASRTSHRTGSARSSSARKMARRSTSATRAFRKS